MEKQSPALSDFDATMIVEGVQEVATAEEYIAAVQHLINTGLAWRLQGFFGRIAASCIEQGKCYDPRKQRAEAAAALTERLDAASEE